MGIDAKDLASLLLSKIKFSFTMTLPTFSRRNPPRKEKAKPGYLKQDEMNCSIVKEKG
jgi:hypothetical protein